MMEKLLSQGGKMNFDPYLTQYTKFNLKRIKALNLPVEHQKESIE